jgi:hypothetical protein
MESPGTKLVYGVHRRRRIDMILTPGAKVADVRPRLDLHERLCYRPIDNPVVPAQHSATDTRHDLP